MARPPFELVQAPVPPRDAPRVVVGLPTLRRPAMLAETLRSLAAQRGGIPFAVVVADNDARGREGAAVMAGMLAAGALAGAAVVVPEPGNCSACNGAFAAARALYPDAPFVAMIDDDEVAEPGWLDALLQAQADSAADLVGGPVLPVFPDGTPRRFRAHPVFKPYYAASGPVPFLYGSGNVLMRAAVLDRLGFPYFDPAFDFVGGGDTDFFKRCRAAGFRAVFAADARARETVPPSRTRVPWVLRRSMRYGTINVMVERKRTGGPSGRMRVLGKSAALLPVSAWRAARALLRTGDPLAASHPVMEAVGRLAAEIGLGPEQYRSRG